MIIRYAGIGTLRVNGRSKAVPYDMTLSAPDYDVDDVPDTPLEENDVNSRQDTGDATTFRILRPVPTDVDDPRMNEEDHPILTLEGNSRLSLTVRLASNTFELHRADWVVPDEGKKVIP